jgi:glycosyltransferase involved in cell wall biosynthesis
MKETLSVCIPVYNGERTISETLRCILDQSLPDFELLILDNASTDNTVSIVKSFTDPRIRLMVNERNIGCGLNLENCKKYASGDILFFMSADDLAQRDALLKVRNAFLISDAVGIVTRPYFWFEDSLLKPVRATKQFEQLEVISLKSPLERIRNTVALFNQISGMSFRKKYMQFKFSEEPFIEIAHMAIPMMKICSVAVVPDNIIAVRISDNGSMNPAVYNTSPSLVWYRVIMESFPEEEYCHIRRYLVDRFVSNNYVGLVQIKAFGGSKRLLREIVALLKLRWPNVISCQFWFFVLVTLLLPGNFLKRIASGYKKRINRFLLNAKILKGWN